MMLNDKPETVAKGAARRSGRGRPRIAFALATVAVSALIALALAYALAHAFMRKPSHEAINYWGLMMVARHPKQATVPWPEYPGGMMTLNEPDPHYRRPWRVPEEKPSDVPWRSVVLGDSHMSGVVPSAEAAVTILDRESSPSQVINMSVSGGARLTPCATCAMVSPGGSSIA